MPSATGAIRVPALRCATSSTRSQMAGWGRSTAAIRAPQLSSTGSGPISAPAPSTATVRPGRASHLRDSPRRSATASAQDRFDDAGGDPRPRAGGAGRRRSAACRGRAPTASRSAVAPVPATCDGGQARAGPAAESTGRRGRSPRSSVPDHPHPPVQPTPARPWPRTSRPASRSARPRSACGSAPGSPSPPVGFPARRAAPRPGRPGASASATTAWPSAEVLLPPVRRGGKGHPGLLVAARRSCDHETIMTCRLCSVRCRG